MAIQFGNITLRYHTDNHDISYETGRQSGFMNTVERYLKPPDGAVGKEAQYGNSTYNTFDSNWWHSQKRVDWINKNAERFKKEMEEKYGHAVIARPDGDIRPLGRPIPTRYTRRQMVAEGEESPRHFAPPSWMKKSVNVFERNTPPRSKKEWREIAKQYEHSGKFSIYTLELREIETMERWWYIGLTNDLQNRIPSHRRKNQYGKDLILWEINDVEQFSGARSEALERERSRAYEFSIEKNTTNVLGGK